MIKCPQCTGVMPDNSQFCSTLCEGRYAEEIDAELARAGNKYAMEFNSLNEALGTIRAEYRELEDDIIRHATPERIKAEALQVAAMCVKLVQYLEI